MKRLDTEFRKRGFNYRMVERTEEWALFQLNGIEHFEVVKVMSHQGREIMGKHFPPAEFMPSDEQWGTYGFSFMDQQQARVTLRLKSGNAPISYAVRGLRRFEPLEGQRTGMVNAF